MHKILKKAVSFMISAAMMSAPSAGLAARAEMNYTNYTYTAPAYGVEKSFLDMLVQDYDTPPLTINAPAVLNDEEIADWAIYIYMCGSNLESQYDAATYDLIEMLKADIPDNVKIIVMTGGASLWNPSGKGDAYNEDVGYDAYTEPSSEFTRIFEIDDKQMTLKYEYEKNLNMGDPATAVSFIEHALEYAPAKHTMLSFWNHGNGLRGAEYDENFDNDKLSVMEIKSVLEALKTAMGGEKIDLVGFDACIMSTFEIACMLSPYADYLIASEEAEPSSGWDYEFLSMFSDWEGAEPPTAIDVGKAIIDQYGLSVGKKAGVGWPSVTSQTMSLTDLSRMRDLADAFNALAEEMLNSLYVNDDYETVAKVFRTAEKTQKMLSGTGMIDLYDFVYNIKDSEPFRESAERVMEVLGTPPGSDAENYNGFVTPENFVGENLGENTAVIYRGTGIDYNNCIGLSFYYPIGGTYTVLTKEAMEIYKNLGLSEAYTFYLLGIDLLSDKFTEFSGELVDEYDNETDLFSVSVNPEEELDKLTNVSYKTVYKTVRNDGSADEYFLGSEQIPDGWDDNKFSKEPYEEWYSLNGNLISMDMTGYTSYADFLGYDVYSYNTMVLILLGDIDDYDNVIMASLYCTKKIRKDDSAPDGEVYGETVVNYIQPVINGYLSDRAVMPDENMHIIPMISVSGQDGSRRYMAYRDSVKLEKVGGEIVLPVEMKELTSGDNVIYSSYFEAVDLNRNTYVSNPYIYALINSFSDYKVVIYPQAYTGDPIEPEVHLITHGQENLTQGVDYKAEYDNNIEKGTASVKITSLIEELPGTVEASFTICDYADLAEEYAKLIPDHAAPEECTEAYEYVEHIKVMELTKYYYESGSELGAESLAKLNRQYNAYLSYSDSSLENNGVELIGAFSAYDGGIYRGELSVNLIARRLNKDLGDDCIGGFDVSMYVQSEDGVLQKTEMISGESVALKTALPQNIDVSSLKIYSLTDETDAMIPIEYSLTERAGTVYAIFKTDRLGSFALFAPASGKITVSIAEDTKTDEDGSVIVKVNISNATGRGITGDVIAAAYNDGALVSLSVMKEQKIKTGTNEMNLTLRNAAGGADNIKIFVWDSISGMTPLSERIGKSL
ncbi:MAG: hypothetical protein J1F64_02695 [Oscillospiraceae bacterium]|nr:hypothetical protein [Oscillospiraceae bacterium]